MQDSRIPKVKPVLKYMSVFILGTVVGGSIMFYMAWGIMSSLMGLKAQMGYQAFDQGKTAMDLTRVLSHLRLGEEKEAISQAEWQLDFFTVKSAATLKETDDPKIVQSFLQQVKRYRTMYPSQSEIKVQVNQTLTTIPAPPAIMPEIPNEKLGALGRLYRRQNNVHS